MQKLFEHDYSFNGKHATYIKYLTKTGKEDKDDPLMPSSKAGIFERYIDVYMNAAVFGLLYDRREEREPGSDRARIYADAFIGERENCLFLYRLVMLLDTSTSLTDEERVNRAFRYDSDPNKEELQKENVELFNSYVRGGIEIIYELFTENCISKEDYIERIEKVTSTFQNELNGESYQQKLTDLINNEANSI